MKLLDERRCRLSVGWFYSPIYLWSAEVTHYQGEVPLLYIFVWDVPAGDRGWNQPCGSYRMFQFVPPQRWHETPPASPTSHFCGRLKVRGGEEEKKEQTRRQWPLTDLTSVIWVHRCQRTNQIKMNGAYPGPLEARLIGPNFISGSNCSYRKINRASDHAAAQETQAHTNRFLLDGRGGVITVLRHRKRRWKRRRRGPPLWWLIERAPQWQAHLWWFVMSQSDCGVAYTEAPLWCKIHFNSDLKVQPVNKLFYW